MVVPRAKACCSFHDRRKMRLDENDRRATSDDNVRYEIVRNGSLGIRLPILNIENVGTASLVTRFEGYKTISST